MRECWLGWLDPWMNGWRGEAFVGSPSESMSHFSSMESRNGHLPTYSSHDGTASCPPPRPSSSSSSMAAQDPPQPRISPSHVDPKFAAPSLSASHLLPIRPVPLSHLQSGQSPTLARVKSSKYRDTDGYRGLIRVLTSIHSLL